MGLDMYVSRIKKADKAKVDEMYGNIDKYEKQYSFFQKEEDGSVGENIKDILPLLQEVALEQTVIDGDRIFKDRGYDPDEVYIFGNYQSCEEVRWSFYPDKRAYEKGNYGNKQKISVTRDEIEKNYLSIEISEYLVCESVQDIQYWRKAFDIDEAICEAAPRPVNNCDYVPFTTDMLNAIKDLDPEGYKKIKQAMDTLGEDEGLFYYIWY